MTKSSCWASRISDTYSAWQDGSSSTIMSCAKGAGLRDGSSGIHGYPRPDPKELENTGF